MQKLPLIAAGGNSSAARRARAALQWRDRFGRWIEMGRGIKFKVRLGTGATVSVNGKFVGATDNPEMGQVYVSKDPNGLKDGFYDVKSSNAQEILASLDPADLAKQGIEVGKDANGNPVGERTDADIQDQATIGYAEAPTGWLKLDESRFKTEDGDFSVAFDTEGRPTMWHDNVKPRAFKDWPSMLDEVDKVDAGESDWDAAYERESAEGDAAGNQANEAARAAYTPTDQEKAAAKQAVSEWDDDGTIGARIDAGAGSDEIAQLLDANIAFRAAKEDYDSRLADPNKTPADKARWAAFEPKQKALARLSGTNALKVGRPAPGSEWETPVSDVPEPAPTPEAPATPEPEAPAAPAGRVDALGDPIPSTPEELQKRLAFLERRVDRANPEDPNFDKIYEARDQIQAEINNPQPAAPEPEPVSDFDEPVSDVPETPAAPEPAPEASPEAPESVPEAPEAEPATPEAAPEPEEAPVSEFDEPVSDVFRKRADQLEAGDIITDETGERRVVKAPTVGADGKHSLLTTDRKGRGLRGEPIDPEQMVDFTPTNPADEAAAFKQGDRISFADNRGNVRTAVVLRADPKRVGAVQINLDKPRRGEPVSISLDAYKLTPVGGVAPAPEGPVTPDNVPNVPEVAPQAPDAPEATPDLPEQEDIQRDPEWQAYIDGLDAEAARPRDEVNDEQLEQERDAPQNPGATPEEDERARFERDLERSQPVTPVPMDDPRGVNDLRVDPLPPEPYTPIRDSGGPENLDAQVAEAQRRAWAARNRLDMADEYPGGDPLKAQEELQYAEELLDELVRAQDAAYVRQLDVEVGPAINVVNTDDIRRALAPDEPAPPVLPADPAPEADVEAEPALGSDGLPEDVDVLDALAQQLEARAAQQAGKPAAARINAQLDKVYDKMNRLAEAGEADTPDGPPIALQEFQPDTPVEAPPSPFRIALLRNLAAAKDFNTEEREAIEDRLANPNIQMPELDEIMDQALQRPNRALISEPREAAIVPPAPDPELVARERDPARDNADPSLILAAVRRTYPNARELANGDLEVDTAVSKKGLNYALVVRRTGRERFDVYLQETNPNTGAVRVFFESKNDHSYTALAKHISVAQVRLHGRTPDFKMNRNPDKIIFPEPYEGGDRLMPPEPMPVDRPSHVSYGGAPLVPGQWVDWTDWRTTQPVKDEFGNVVYQKNADGSFRLDGEGRKIAVTEPNPTYGQVFRGYIKSLREKDNGHRNGKANYEYTDTVWFISPEYNKLKGSKPSRQRNFVSSNLKIVDGPDAPPSPAFFKKKEEVAGVERNLPAPAGAPQALRVLAPAVQWPVPNNPRPGQPAVNLPKPAIAAPPLPANLPFKVPLWPDDMLVALDNADMLSVAYKDLEVGDILRMNDGEVRRGRNGRVVNIERQPNGRVIVDYVRPNAGSYELRRLDHFADQKSLVYRQRETVSPNLEGNAIEPKGLDQIREWAADIRRRFDNGIQRIVFKPSGGIRHTRAEVVELNNGAGRLFIKGAIKGNGDFEREILANRVANAVGISDIHLEGLDDDETLIMTVASGDLASKRLGQAQKILANPHAFKNGARIGLMDYLIGNTDRHTSNWFVDDEGNPVPIDHGFVWSNRGHDATSPFAKKLVGGNTSSPQITANFPYSLADLEQVRENLESLRDEFIRFNKLDWYDLSVRRLNRLIGLMQ